MTTTETEYPKPRPSLPKGALAVVALLSLFPALFLAWSTTQNWVNVPLADQWDFIPTLVKVQEGQFTPLDLWVQHNEHRLIFPRLAMLALAALSGWDVRWEMAFSFLLGCGIFLTLAHQVRQTGRAVGVETLGLALPLVSLITFSLSQSENWLWGWQLQILMSVLASVVTIVLLAEPAFCKGRFALAACTATVATYSFGNGAVIWLVGAAVIAALYLERGRELTLKLLGIWIVVAGLVMASYLVGYHKPGSHPSLLEVFHHPLRFIDYVFLYFGAPVIAFSQKGAFYSGILAFLLTLGGAAWMVRARLVRLSVVIPYLGITLYVLLSASITGLARLGFGSPQALSSRYVTIASPFWAAHVVMAILVITLALRGQPSVGRKFAAGFLSVLVLLLTLRLGATSFVDGRAAFAVRRDMMQAARVDLLAGRDTDAVRALYPNYDVITTETPSLQKYRFSCFRETLPVETSR